MESKKMKINFENLFEQELDIYIKYKYLDAGELAEIILNLNKLYSKVLNISSPVYTINDRPMRNFMEVSDVHTGDSIRISLKEGWRPEFNLDENEIKIKIPKKIAVPALVLFFLLNAFKYSIDTHNAVLDNQLKRLDIEIKKIELYQKLKESKSIISSERSIKMQSNKTIKYFIQNENITNVYINEIEVPMSNKK